MKIEQLLQAVSESQLNELDLTAWQNKNNQQPAGPVTQTGGTGDPTLNQPLPAQQPKQGGGFVKGLANVVGQTAKGIGAVAGAPAGIGRAIKKGYTAGANAIGGPGAAPTTAATGTTGTSAGAGDELAQLRSQLQVMQQKLARAGIQQ